VLTNHPAKISSALRALGLIAAAFVLSAATLAPAHAGGFGDLSCVGPWRSFSCVAVWGALVDPYVRIVPPDALSEEERAQLAARDRRWTTHCRPVLERDRYGVARYRYWDRGCEYGIGAD
jgi:hypothetical protein